MLLRRSIVLLSVFLFVLLGSRLSPVAQAKDCNTTPPSRLQAGSQAQTFNPVPGDSSGSQIRLRVSPATTASIVTTLLPNTLIHVLEGPSCGENLAWWRVQVVESGVQGWVVEGQGNLYYLIPVEGAPAPTLQPTPELSEPPTPTPVDELQPGRENASADWTIMIYMAADNNLESYAIDNFNLIEQIKPSDKVNVLVEIDRAESYDSRDGDWTGARRYHIVKQDRTPAIANIPESGDLGEIDTSDPRYLIDFATWGIQKFPAKHYALVMWGHGGAWRGIASDDSADNKALNLTDLGQALNQITSTTNIGKIDLLGFDACLMGSIETYSTIAPYAQYAVGSEELVPGTGWDYRFTLAQLYKNSAVGPKDLGENIVSNYVKSYDKGSLYDSYSISLVDLSRVGGLQKALGDFINSYLNTANPEFASSLLKVRNQTFTFGGFDQPRYADIWSATDLSQFMNQILVKQADFDTDITKPVLNLISAQQQLVIDHRPSAALSGSGGLSIYFPRNKIVYGQGDDAHLYINHQPTNFSDWEKFLQRIYEQADSTLGQWPTGQLSKVSANSKNQVVLGLTEINTDQLSVVIELPGEDKHNIIVDYQSRDSDQQTSTWDGQIPQVSSSTVDGGVPVLLNRNPTNFNSASIDGRFYLNGKESDAQLVFNLKDLPSARPIRGWILDPDKGILSALDLREGGEFEPYWLYLDENGNLAKRLSQKRFNLEDDTFVLSLTPPPIATLNVSVVAEDISGHTQSNTIDLPVTENGIDIAAANQQIQANLKPDGAPDKDGIATVRDNCPLVKNVDQADSDNDTIGDACDTRNDLPPAPSPVFTGIPQGSAALSSGGQGVWRFAGTEGQAATIDVTSGFDNSVSLIDPNGEILAYNDDFGGDLGHSRIENFTLPADGEYSAVVTGFSVDDFGSYDISITTGEAVGASNTVFNMSIGDTVSGTLNANGRHTWNFYSLIGQAITADLHGTFDTQISLYDPYGNLIASNDDFGDYTHSYLGNIELPVSGRYSLVVESYSQDTSGVYNLSLGAGTVTQASAGGSITPDQIVSANLAIGQTQDWAFSAQAGDVFSIDVNASFDSTVELFDSDGKSVAYNDDYTSAYNSHIDYTFNQARSYTIRVGSYSNSGGGSYQIVISSKTDDSASGGGTQSSQQITEGIPVSGYLFYGTTQDWIFTAQAGAVLTIDVNASFDSTIELLDPAGNSAAQNDDFTLVSNSRIESYTFTKSGDYTIRVGSYLDGGEGDYLLMVNTFESFYQLGFNQTFWGNLSVGETDVWTFYGQGNQIISINAAPYYTDMTLGIALIQPDGTAYVPRQRRPGGTPAAPLQGIQLFQTGTYRIEISAPLGQEGVYSLEVLTSHPATSSQSSIPPPPPAKLCFDMNFETNGVLRSDLELDRFDVNCRLLVENGRYFSWYGSPLTYPAQIGDQNVLDMGVLQAVDVFSPAGETHFKGDVVICLLGGGQLIYMNANEAPRIPRYITAWRTPSFPGYTCGTLYEPGTLMLIGGEMTTLVATPPPTLEHCYVTTTNAVRMRAEPNTTSDVLGTLAYQRRLRATDYHSGWYQVQYLDKIGWVSSDYLTTDGDCVG